MEEVAEEAAAGSYARLGESLEWGQVRGRAGGHAAKGESLRQ